MLALTLLLLSAADDAPRLPTPEQLADAPVEWLTVPQLEAQSAPVEKWGSISAARSLLFIGITATALGLVLIPLTLFTARDYGPAIVGFGLAGHFMFSGVLLGNLGGAMLPRLMTVHDRTDRSDAARSRLTEIRGGRATAPEAPRDALISEYGALREQRPNAALPSLLLGAGSMLITLGAPLLVSQQTTNRPDGTLHAVSIGLVCAGIAAVGLGLFTLIRDLRERDAIDAQLEELRQRADAFP